MNSDNQNSKPDMGSVTYSPWRKVVCLLILFLILPLTILFILNTESYNKELESSLLENNIAILTSVRDSSDELLSTLQKTRDLLLVEKDMVDSYWPQNYMDANNLRKLLMRHVYANASIYEIFLHSGNDEYLFSTLSSYNYQTLAHKYNLDAEVLDDIFQNSIEKFRVYPVYDSHYSLDCLLFCSSFFNKSIPRTVIISLNSNQLKNVLQRARIPQGGAVYIFDNEDVFLENVGMIDNTPDSSSVLDLLKGYLHTGITNESLLINEKEYYVSECGMTTCNLRLVLVSPAETALSPAIQQKRTSILLFTCVIVFTIILSIPTLIVIFSPITQLKRHIHGSVSNRKSSKLPSKLLNDETHTIISYMEDLQGTNTSLTENITKLKNDFSQSFFHHLLMLEVNTLDDYLNAADIARGSEYLYRIFIISSKAVISEKDIGRIDEILKSFDPSKFILKLVPQINTILGVSIFPASDENLISSFLNQAVFSYNRTYSQNAVLGMGSTYRNCVFAQQSLIEAICAADDVNSSYLSNTSEFTLDVNDPETAALFSALTNLDSVSNVSGIQVLELIGRVSMYMLQPEHSLSQIRYIGYKALVYVNVFLTQNKLYNCINLYPYIIRIASYNSRPEIEQFVHGVLSELVGKVPISQNEQQNELFNDMVAYIHEHISDEQFSVSDMAEHFSMSIPIISKYFKDSSGNSIMSYMTLKRIDLACNLLRSTDQSVKEIGIAVGYVNDSSFIRRFRSIMGISPGQYRQEPDRYRIPTSISE